MRIIAGRLGGRVFDSPSTRRTHPMGDKVRGALFNTLGELDGMSVLDAFAGSGALGLEAISRGAHEVTALDIDKSAVTTINKNASDLGISNQVKATKVSARAWLRTQPTLHFDIVLCDPPYDDIQPTLLRDLADRVVDGGLVVFSLPSGITTSLSGDFKLLSTKSYGDATLTFYRRELA